MKTHDVVIKRLVHFIRSKFVSRWAYVALTTCCSRSITSAVMFRGLPKLLNPLLSCHLWRLLVKGHHTHLYHACMWLHVVLYLYSWLRLVATRISWRKVNQPVQLIYTCMFIHVYMHACLYMHVHTCCMHVHTCIHACSYMYTCMFIHVYMFIHACTYMCSYMYTCMFIHTYTG